MDIVFHILVPFALLLLLGVKLAKKRIPLLVLLAILPDIDRVFGMKRELFHNFFFVILITLIIFIFTKDKKLFVLCSFFLLSHLILDIYYYEAIFFPFNRLFYRLGISIRLENNMPRFDTLVETTDTLPPATSTIISTQGFGVLTLFIALLIAKRKKQF